LYAFFITYLLLLLSLFPKEMQINPDLTTVCRRN